MANRRSFGGDGEVFKPRLLRALHAKGATLDLAWKDGVVTSYQLTSATPQTMIVRIGDHVEQVTTVVR